MGVEATVTTWRICSRADRPPPIWKATWSAVFCWGMNREGTESEYMFIQGTTRHSTDGVYVVPTARRISPTRAPDWNRQLLWSLKYSCLISKVHNLAPPRSKSTFNRRQMICRLRFTSGWSQWMTIDWSETGDMPNKGPLRDIWKLWPPLTVPIYKFQSDKWFSLSLNQIKLKCLT